MSEQIKKKPTPQEVREEADAILDQLKRKYPDNVGIIFKILKEVSHTFNVYGVLR